MPAFPASSRCGEVLSGGPATARYTKALMCRGEKCRLSYLFHARSLGNGSVPVDKRLPAVLLRVRAFHRRRLRHLRRVWGEQARASFPGFRGRLRDRGHGSRGTGLVRVVSGEVLAFRRGCHRGFSRQVFAGGDVFEFDLCHFRCHNLDWHRCSFSKSFFQHDSESSGCERRSHDGQMHCGSCSSTK